MVVAVVAGLVALLAGPDANTSDRLGEPCDQVGQLVVDDAGRSLACTTTLVDRQPRWRTGRLDLPTR
ncbi:hypothetical protein [Micromonospora sp. NPDC051006]|uniref:hypothetical protein n=1 Tax=Micromonospora sp. NPDC051006 TaxID=3364283 RepID=UPI0037A1CDB7